MFLDSSREVSDHDLSVIPFFKRSEGRGVEVSSRHRSNTQTGNAEEELGAPPSHGWDDGCCPVAASGMLVHRSIGDGVHSVQHPK